LPVHSAHVGQEIEVHYRWHPYFGCTVSIRRVEQRATGLFFKVQGPAGVVVSMAAWMLDPVTCAGMTIGTPQVDRAALIELDQLLIDKGRNRRSPIDAAIVQRNAMKIAKVPVPTPVSRQLNLLFDAKCLAGLSSPDRSKVRQLLAQILMQAAGLSVEELDDDKR
jgi:hypothetical protein